MPLSPRQVEALRTHWRKDRPAAYRFPGKTPDAPYASTSIQKEIKAGAQKIA